MSLLKYTASSLGFSIPIEARLISRGTQITKARTEVENPNNPRPVEFVTFLNDLVLVQRPALLHTFESLHLREQFRLPCFLRFGLFLQASAKLKLLGRLGALLLLLTFQFRQTLLQLTHREIIGSLSGRDRGCRPSPWYHLSRHQTCSTLMSLADFMCCTSSCCLVFAHSCAEATIMTSHTKNAPPRPLTATPYTSNNVSWVF